MVLARDGWVKANWLSRGLNQVADMLSKSSIDTWELSLSNRITDNLFSKWFKPTMDMFASQRCHVTARYFSWYPDKLAVARDAFSIMHNHENST